MTSESLVSIGVPTFNRADLLEHALRDLVAQTYRPIEIVVSDNASTDGTEEVCRAVDAGRGLIRHVCQPVTVPPPENFRTALRESSGEFFMWAADDDGWHPSFVETLVRRLRARPSAVLAAAEAQYRLPDGTLLPFLPEGGAWYGPAPDAAELRLNGVVDDSYGNLIYGLYRRAALADGPRTVLDDWTSLNEIPVFLHVAARGGIEVVPEVLFFKTAPLSTYLVVAHERGVRPPVPHSDGDGGLATALTVRRLLESVVGSATYHRSAWQDCARAVHDLPVPAPVRRRTARRLAARLAVHAGTAVVASVRAGRHRDPDADMA